MTNAFNVRGRRASISKISEHLPDEASDNFSQRSVSMTFNMPDDWHRRFKMTAAARGLSMKELLLECFALYEREGR